MKGFMRLDPKVLTDVILGYLRDGWQVVSAGDHIEI